MERNRACTLPVPALYLVPANNWSVRWAEMQQRYSYLPQAEQATAAFCDLALRGKGLPASMYKNKEQKDVLHLYGPNYYIGLYASPRGDGYILGYIKPIDPLSHDTLADGVLLLRGITLHLCARLPDIPHGSTNCQAFIMQEWENLRADKQQWRAQGQSKESATVAHKNYLDTLSFLIDKAYELEQNKYMFASKISYTSFSATDEQRSGRHDIYEFRLYQPLQIWQERYILRISGVPDLRGRIMSLSGTRATIKFEALIDRKRIPQQGSFEIVPNTRIADLQRQAVAMFYQGTARNPHLLRVLVDHLYQPYKPSAEPQSDLNREQLAAFQHALTVPDLLLVLGPPGTGKTHTITEIIRQHCSVNKKRVLVSAHTHKAVDNVLSRLPGSLEVVRLGHEDLVSEDTRHLLAGAKAKKIQQEILGRTALQASGLACFVENAAEIEQWRNDLARLGKQIEQYEWQERQVQTRRQVVIERNAQVFAEERAALEKEIAEHERQLAALEKSLKRWRSAWEGHVARVHLLLIGRFFVWRVQRCQEHERGTLALYEETQAWHAVATQEYVALQTRMQQALWSDHEYRMIEDERQQIERNLYDSTQGARKLLGLLHAVVERVQTVGPRPSTVDGAMLRAFTGWCDRYVPLFQRRAALLREWREQRTEERTAQLRSELIRYADVIGATCIGVATVEDLESIDFDLAIVDEAGQICLTDLLVPLARAERAVLVGDHQQLPPFVGQEVRDWLNNLSDQEEEEGYGIDHETVRNHLTRSAFELLFVEADRNRRLVRLTRQFRMPQVVADFASRYFYGNQLTTAHPQKLLSVPHRDPLFRSPLAVINSASLAQRGQYEQKRLKSEEWGGEGCVNVGEAVLITALAACYEQHGMSWVVIVPYRAQVQYVIELLQKELSDAVMRWEDRVSTVDAFQGRECEKVIYGFTRSNPRGEVGFLKDVRRLNVALTRAKEQLIVVGDFTTLMRASDEGFRALARALYQHAEQYGEVVSYEECMQRISARRQRE